MARGDKRKQIMQAAEKLFASRRLDEITLDDVVGAAHVGKGTVYRYFKDKDDLFFQTAASGFDHLQELLAHKVPQDKDFREQLLTACREISRFFEGRKQLFCMMQAEAGRVRWQRGEFRHQWKAGRKKVAAALADILRRGVADGQVRDDVPAEVLASILLGMLRARARDLSDQSAEHRSHEMLIDLFCNGARPPAGGGVKKATMNFVSAPK